MMPDKLLTRSETYREREKVYSCTLVNKLDCCKMYRWILIKNLNVALFPLTLSSKSWEQQESNRSPNLLSPAPSPWSWQWACQSPATVGVSTMLNSFSLPVHWMMVPWLGVRRSSRRNCHRLVLSEGVKEEPGGQSAVITIKYSSGTYRILCLLVS